MEITTLLASCASKNASDLHLAPGQAPIMRVNGDLQRMAFPPFDPNVLTQCLLNTMNESERRHYSHRHYCDLRLQVDSLTHCRVHVYQQRQGIAAAFRLITAIPPTIDELGLPPIVRHIANSPHGLILVTGASGSGKSSSLAAMIDYRNSTSPCHILTLEDPIEFLHESKCALVSQCALSHDVPDYAEALKCALREDPDIIMVGEMRDAATIALALEAAETGHLVLSSLHTSSARNSIARIIGSFAPEAQETIRTQLSLSLVAVIAQTLPKSIDGSRRIVAHEVLLATRAMRNLIRENRLAQIDSLIQTSQKMGMHTLDQCLQQMINSQIISVDEARRHSVERPWEQT